MPRKQKELSSEERQIILNLKNQGKSYGEISIIVNRSRATVQSVIRRFTNRDTTVSKRRNGRPRKLGKMENQFIKRLVRAKPDLHLREIKAQLKEHFGVQIHRSTICRALHHMKLKSCVALKKPYISETNRKKRLMFAKLYEPKTIDFWKKCLFSDESKFNICGNDGTKRVWRRPGEQYRPKHLCATVKHGGGSVFVWGCMSASGVGELKFIKEIMNKYVYLNILKDNLQKSDEKLNLVPDYYFQQDNDPKHTAYIVRQWLLFHTLHLLVTPPQSPDINPIEHLWAHLKTQLRRHDIRNKQQLEKMLLEEWNKISPIVTEKLVYSMPRRLKAIIRAKGGPTKY